LLKSRFHQYSNKPYTLGLAADQNPHNPNNAFWIDFFGKKTAFVKGPEKGSKNQNTAVVMVYINRTRLKYPRY
jgi:lauroyl/myristoyl acyltransferase